MKEVGTLREVGTLSEVGPRVIGRLSDPGSVEDLGGPEVLGVLSKRDYLAEAASDVSEAEELMKHHPSELPPEYSQTLGESPFARLFGARGFEEPKTTQERELLRRKVGQALLKSPKALAAIEGIGDVLPEGLLEDKAPTVEEVYHRPKTITEEVVGGATQLAGEIPMFMLGGTGAKAILGTGYAGKKMSLKILSSAMRGGTTGSIFHAGRNFADQMFDDTTFDPVDLGAEALTGFATWGALSALGPPASRVFGKGWNVISPRMKGLAKLKLRANGNGLSVTVTDKLPEHLNKRMIEVVDGSNLGVKHLFGDVKTANAFLKNIEAEGFGHLVGDKSWVEALSAVRRARARLESSMYLNPRDVGRLEGQYQKVFGNIIYLSRRLEENVMGKGAVKDLRKKAFSLGLKGEEARTWLGKQMAARSGSARLYTDVVEPLLEGDRLAKQGVRKFNAYLYQRLVKGINKVAADTGKTSQQVAIEITEWIEAIGPRDPISPKTIINNIMKWRTVSNQADRINRFVRANNMPESSVDKLLNLTLVGPRRLSQIEIKRQLGSAIEKAAPFKSTIPGETKLTTEFVERLHRFTSEQVELAKVARKALNHLFRVGDVNPDMYMRFYVPLRRASGLMDWEQAQKLMRSSMPEYAWSKAKFFARMHREGNKFIPERSIIRLLTKYTNGAFRAQHLNDIINDSKLKVSMIKSKPIQKRFTKFMEDITVGMDDRTQQAVFGAMSDATKGYIPEQIVSDIIDTAMAATYGSTMGFRPFLIMRNALQTTQTTLPLVGPKALAQGWLDVGEIIPRKVAGKWSFGKLFDDFLAEGIHMRKGAGLPFGEEFGRAWTMAGVNLSQLGTGWTKVSQVLAAWRKVSEFSTLGYQFADHLNRFVTYRAMIHRIEAGLAKKGVVDNLANKAMKIASRLPMEKVEGSITGADVIRSRWNAVTQLTESPQMDRLIAATGLRNAFEATTNNRLFSRRLAELLFTGSRIRGKRFQDLYLLKSRKATSDIIREAFLGHKGTLAEELGRVMGTPGTKTVMEAFNDSFARHAARLAVADTQWVYNKIVQSPLMQVKIFGMFGTWSANIIDYARRHALEIGTPLERAKKFITLATVLATTYKALEQVGINGMYLFTAFVPFTGGPYIQPLYDLIAQGRYIPEYEKEAARKRLYRTPLQVGQLMVPGYSQARSLYRTATGDKAPLPGILGAAEGKDRSGYERSPEISTKGLTTESVNRLKAHLSAWKKAETDVERQLVHIWLSEDLYLITGYPHGDPIKQAERLIKAAPRPVKEGELL